jgi:LemA protein
VGIWAIVILVVLVLIVVGGIASYNRFVSQRNLIKDAWANIDTELRRRYDLIPNLVSTVQGYAAHEKQVFEDVTKARAMATAATGSPAAQAAAEGPFVAALRQLLAVAENYPQLKANENFLALQAELQTARRFYNGNVRDYNRRVQSFPSMIIARFGNFQPEEFFEVDESLRGDAGVPKVDFSTMGQPAAAQPTAPAVPAEPPAAPPSSSGGGSSPPPPPPS